MEGRVGIAERVTAERTRRGWSQRQAAERVGMNNATWARIERDGRLSDRSRALIAEAFDWPLDWPDIPDDGIAPTTRLDALEQRVADLEAFVRTLTRTMLEAPAPDVDVVKTVEERRRLEAKVAELERQISG